MSVIGLCSCASGPKSVSLESSYTDNAVNNYYGLTENKSAENETTNNKHNEGVICGGSLRTENIISGGDSQLSVINFTQPEDSSNQEIPATNNEEPFEIPLPILPDEVIKTTVTESNMTHTEITETANNESLLIIPSEEENRPEEVKNEIKQTSSTDQLVLKTDPQTVQNIPTHQVKPIFKTITNSAEPRKPLQNVSSSHTPEEAIANRANWEDFRDEHLLDGGDRKFPIHFDKYGYGGLETEDTFAEYTDHTGKTIVKPTNELMIYSPRFGAVRTIHKPLAGVEIAKVAGSHRTERTGGRKKRIATSHHGQRVGTDRIRVRSRLSGLDYDSVLSGLSERTVVSENSRVNNTYVNLVTTYFGGFNQEDKAALASGLQAAITWTRDDNPIISASTSAGMNIESVFILSELVGEEDQKTKGRLKIIKMADKKSAERGEIVKFTIHFTNLGDRELKNIRVIDNLTPRLEYISESASSELEGRLDVYDNGEGSLILTFEISEELKGHQSAKVTFDCRVK